MYGLECVDGRVTIMGREVTSLKADWATAFGPGLSFFARVAVRRNSPGWKAGQVGWQLTCLTILCPLTSITPAPIPPPGNAGGPGSAQRGPGPIRNEGE